MVTPNCGLHIAWNKYMLTNQRPSIQRLFNHHLIDPNRWSTIECGGSINMDLPLHGKNTWWMLQHQISWTRPCTCPAEHTMRRSVTTNRDVTTAGTLPWSLTGWLFRISGQSLKPAKSRAPPYSKARVEPVPPLIGSRQWCLFGTPSAIGAEGDPFGWETRPSSCDWLCLVLSRCHQPSMNWPMAMNGRPPMERSHLKINPSGQQKNAAGDRCSPLGLSRYTKNVRSASTYL